MKNITTGVEAHPKVNCDNARKLGMSIIEKNEWPKSFKTHKENKND